MELTAKKLKHKTKVIDIPFDFNRYDKMVISNSDIIYVIDISDILFIKAEEGRSVFYLIDKTIIADGAIESHQNTLDERFFKVHESYVINLLHIREIDENYSNLTLYDNKIVPVASLNMNLFKELLERQEN